MPLTGHSLLISASLAIMPLGMATASAQTHFDPLAIPSDITVGTVSDAPDPSASPAPPVPPPIPAPLSPSPADGAEGPVAQAPVAPSPDSDSDGDAPAVDETALRYFAQQGDTRRLQAEIARLRALYPDWTPPEDPLQVPQRGDERLERMWLLYSEGRYAEVRREISQRQTDEPGWTVPQDLIDRLSVAEARERLVNASDLRQFETVVRLGSENPSLLTCTEIDVLWRVAEGFAETDRASRAADAYRYILTNCDDAEERLATMQKALPLLEREVVEDLLSLERVDDAGLGEFEAIRDEIARQAVAEGDADPTVTVSGDHLQRIANLFEEGALASDALLLGWYYLRRDRMSEAADWFRRARNEEDSASASQGLALTQIAADAFRDAEETIYPWRDASEDAGGVYLAAVANLLAVEPPILLDETILQRMVPEVVDARDVASAQQFGWYSRALNQFDTAASWFETALGWDPDDEPSAYGLALTRQQLGDSAGVIELQRIWAGRSERITRIGDPNADAPAEEGRVPSPVANNDRTMAAYSETTRRPSEGATAIARQTTPAGQREAGPTVALQPVATAQPAMPSRQSAAQPAASGSTRPASQSGCATYVNPERLSSEAALTRGWCLMELNRPTEAAGAFEIALRSASEATRRDASYGQSLAYLRAGLIDEAALSATRSRQSIERGAELEAAILAERALGAFEHRQYTQTILILDRRARIAAERTDLLVLRAYAYLNLNRLVEAEQLFEAAASAGSRDGMRGLADVRNRRAVRD
jgi:cellulose synthase operon protein C